MNAPEALLKQFQVTDLLFACIPPHLLLLLLPVVLLLIHGQNNHELPEDGHKVQEEIHRVPDVVFVSHLSLLNDELSVKQHKSTHDDQTEVHVSRKQHDRPQEHVEERDQEQDGQSGH